MKKIIPPGSVPLEPGKTNPTEAEKLMNEKEKSFKGSVRRFLTLKRKGGRKG